MAQQQSRGDRTRTLITMLVLWGIGFYALQTWGPKPPPAPAVVQNIQAEAARLDAEARKEDPNVALGDRVLVSMLPDWLERRLPARRD